VPCPVKEGLKQAIRVPDHEIAFAGFC